jgi:hypothetical protein
MFFVLIMLFNMKNGNAPFLVSMNKKEQAPIKGEPVL